MEFRRVLSDLRGEGDWAISKQKSCTAKTAENSCKESHGKKIEQVLPTTQVPCLTFKKILAHGLAHQKIHYAQPKGERKISCHSPP